MELIPMNPSHVAQVAALERVCFTDPWSEASVAGELDNELSLWLVAVEGETVLGYVGSQTVLDSTDILNVAVSPDHRGCGIGRALLTELEQRLRQQGVTEVLLEVRPSNAPAIALYTSLGFVQVGRRPNYYLNPREDALILKKEWNT
ncbi:MAG TPA: ribosomal protein S18-alanine N-acetyltransferase [Candidatus Avoscillospira avistercoris]|uniref:[Ribosomal protein bS18]-alanine N-acetyltransferase n=1 Tax=Candidatus Avoscillospira avistercoris TaxID=2840707 RepID=A0A9D1F8A4_9FIRM|nr:ribosomal protein S18-alanine N-acetyltransferase [Candidatus Avoscillospira avistercoris]